MIKTAKKSVIVYNPPLKPTDPGWLAPAGYIGGDITANCCDNWDCTRPPDHAGAHASHYEDDSMIATWE